MKAIAAPLRRLVAPGTGERPLGRAFVDDAKVSDHHAIIPTGVSPANACARSRRTQDLRLVCRRLLSAWHDDHVWAVTTVITAGPQRALRIASSQRHGGRAGRLEGARPRRGEEAKGKAEDGEGGDRRPAAAVRSRARPAAEVVDVESIAKKTRAPKRFTEGTLLTAMETAGKTLDEKSSRRRCRRAASARRRRARRSSKSF